MRWSLAGTLVIPLVLRLRVGLFARYKALTNLNQPKMLVSMSENI